MQKKDCVAKELTVHKAANSATLSLLISYTVMLCASPRTDTVTDGPCSELIVSCAMYRSSHAMSCVVAVSQQASAKKMDT